MNSRRNETEQKLLATRCYVEQILTVKMIVQFEEAMAYNHEGRIQDVLSLYRP